jgi:hypothetical protein
MKRMLIASALALACLTLAGCAGGIANLPGLVTGSTVSPQAVSVAENSFDALETTATAYFQLPACGAGAPVTCRNQTVAAKIAPAIRSGRTARDQLESLLRTNNGGPVPIANYNTLTAAISSLQSVYTQYQIATSAK